MTAVRTRQRHRGRTLLIVALVLLVLLIAADRIAKAYAEHTAARLLRTSQHLSSTPDVTVTGTPFLTQIVARKFPEIDVTARDVPLGSSSAALTLSTVHVALHDVTLTNGFSTAHAATADATATIGYPDLGRRLGVPLHYAGGGRVGASLRLTISGRSVDVSASAAPTLRAGALVLTDVRVDGSLGPVAGLLPIGKQLTVPISLTGFPFGIHVQALNADASGVELSLTGSDLSYTRAS